MSLAPLDLVSAHPWKNVTFTTYALSLSFFEAVVLDALVRGRSSPAMILADVRGVRSSLSEQGAQLVGKLYNVEPIAVPHGVFHAKVSVFSADDDCHLLVGSGNLTFGGWGDNCEVLEHLHPSFAADAFADSADFFELLPVAIPRFGADQYCAVLANDLRQPIRNRVRTGNIRVLHNLDRSLSEQITQLASDLGGATRMVVAAPFWDSGSAIDDLCESIGLDHLFVHAHQSGAIEGARTSNWPRGCRTDVRAVRIPLFDDHTQRPLHAKAFEVMCRRGRVLVSGSANATAAALGPMGNVEACVARIARERLVGWPLTATEPLEVHTQLEDPDDDDQGKSGVLRAALDSDVVTGVVLTPNMTGPARVFYLDSLVGPQLIAPTTIAFDGAFRVSAPSLAERLWQGGRLVIRVQHLDGSQAEGFVSVRDFVEVKRRAGLVFRHLLALLNRSETPDDIVAIIAYFIEVPLDPLVAHSAGPIDGVSLTRRERVDELLPVAALSLAYDSALFPIAPNSNSITGSQQIWSRFIDHILAAFRERRGPLAREVRRGDDDDTDDTFEALRNEPDDDPVITRTFMIFEQLFSLLTRPGVNSRNTLLAFDLAQYVCDRLRPNPSQAKKWLDDAIKALLTASIPPDRRADLAAAVVTSLGASSDRGHYRLARGWLLRIGVDFSDEAPPPDGASGFLCCLPQRSSFSEIWSELRSVRTYQEQVRSYLRAVQRGEPFITDYAELPRDAADEWPALEEALTSSRLLSRFLIVTVASDVCPCCNMSLPTSEIAKLRKIGIATTKNCCRRIVICKGE